MEDNEQSASEGCVNIFFAKKFLERNEHVTTDCSNVSYLQTLSESMAFSVTDG